MARESLHQLYVDQLRDLYNAEAQILKALPKMIEKTTHTGLRQALEFHARQTQGHVERLDRIFTMLGERPEGEKCKGMEGVIDEGQDTIKRYDDQDVRDAALIAAAQRVEHYEMAAYGCVRTYAGVLGLPDQQELLQQTLNEEGDADHKLTQLAEEVVNVDALRAG
jgi:ferritin-like metal-binding protein YciE